MNKSIIFIALLLALTTAIKLEQVNSQLKKIESTKFGKNLLDMIQLQLSTSDGVDTLLNELHNLDQDLSNEQQVDNAEHEKLEQECADDKQRLEQEIADAQAKSAELASEIEVKTPIRDQKVIYLAEKEEEKVSYEQSIVAIDAYKAELDATWASNQDDHQKATYTIQRAKEVIVGEFQKGSSFLQKNINFVQLSKHFSDSAKQYNFQKKSWNKIFKVLAQITSSAPVQADSGAIAKIVELCDELLNKLSQSLQLERESYNDSVQTYNHDRATFVENLQDTKLVIDNLESEIKALNNRLQSAANEKTQQDQRAQEKSEELAKRTAYCEDQAQQYKQRTDTRNEQQGIVRQVIDIINSQLRVLKKYVGDKSE